MITLIIGKKGSGKTKKLIDAANAAIEKTNGNVVVIEKEAHLTLDISHQARLVALEPYGITGCAAFYGFISGICAGNCVCETRTGKDAQCGNSIKKFPQIIWKKFGHIV